MVVFCPSYEHICTEVCEVRNLILKPTNMIPDSQTFSSSETIEFKWKTNGDIMSAFELIIEDNNTGLQAYTTGKINSYTPTYLIPPSTLRDGIAYRYKLVIYNSVGGSITSDYKIFTCSSKPIVTIQTDGYIRNQIAYLNANYYQAENVPIKCFMFILRDEYNNILESSNYIYSPIIEYTFSSILIDDTHYKVECLVVTQNDLAGTSGPIQFIADYISPIVHFKLGTEIVVDEPFLRLSWTTVRIIGETLGATSYIDGSKLDVRAVNSKVFFDDGYTLENNFTVRIWANSPSQNINNPIVEIPTLYGKMIVYYENNKVHVLRYFNSIITHIASNVLPFIGVNNQLYICIQQDNGRLNILSEVI